MAKLASNHGHQATREKNLVCQKNCTKINSRTSKSCMEKKFANVKKLPTKIKKNAREKTHGRQKLYGKNREENSRTSKAARKKNHERKKLKNLALRDRLSQNSQEGSLWLAGLADGSGYQITTEYPGTK